MVNNNKEVQQNALIRAFQLADLQLGEAVYNGDEECAVGRAQSANLFAKIAMENGVTAEQLHDAIRWLA